MARPPKVGLSYFPLDTVLDVKFDLIEAEFGLTGFGVVVKLWQNIYAARGYYIEWTNEVALLFARKIGVGGDVVSEIVNASIKRGIFDKGMFDKYSILTSCGIQKRYETAVGRRKACIKSEYLLLNCTQNTESNSETPVYADNNLINVSNNATNKRKENKIIEKKTTTNKTVSAEIGEYVVVVQAYEQNVGTVTPAVLADIKAYIDLGFEQAVIAKAIEKAAFANKPNWGYVRGVLNNWHNDGAHTLAVVSARGKKSPAFGVDKPASYDINELDAYWDTVPKLEDSNGK